VKAALLLLSLLLIMPADQVDLKVRPAPDFGNGDVWLDQGAPAPHHISGYRGHVVLIDFWEYSCINCIRTFAENKKLPKDPNHPLFMLFPEFTEQLKTL
jgi:thiol-disulfide isomerase/thioredoxin